MDLDESYVERLGNITIGLLDKVYDAGVTNAELTRRIHVLENELRHLWNDLEEQTAAYKEAETGRQAEKHRNREMAAQFDQYCYDVQRHIQDKNEEIKTIRKQTRIEIEQLYSCVVETEKLKTEVTRVEKELQIQITELKLSLVNAHETDIDSQKNIKKHSLQTEQFTAEQLWEEQEKNVKIKAFKKPLEIEIKNISERLGEVEANAIASGQRIISKLEESIKALELEIDEEKRRHSETIKILDNKEHQLQRLIIQREEDRRNIAYFRCYLEKYFRNIDMCKKQSDEKEGMSQCKLETAEDRADVAESSLSLNSTNHRTLVTTSSVPDAQEAHRPAALAFLSTSRYRGAIPVEYKPIRSLNDVELHDGGRE